MKLKTLDELGAANKAGCLKLPQEWHDAVYISQVLAKPNYWPEGHDRTSVLVARYHRFNDGIHSLLVDGLEKLVERRAIEIAENGFSGIAEGVESLLNKEKISCRVSQHAIDVVIPIAQLYATGQYSKASDLAEAYDMTIYTCKSCDSWHVLKNDDDPACPDCEYSLDEVL